MLAEISNPGASSARWTEYLLVGNVQVGMRTLQLASRTLATRYFHTDHLGSIAVITDTTGSVVERLSYDAWGKRRKLDGTDDTAGSITSQTTRGFTGQEQLSVGGLVHLNGRVYDPLLARMTSADPTVTDPTNAQGWNRYSYVGNDPLAFTDPSGFSWLSRAWSRLTNFVASNPILRSVIQIVATVVLNVILPGSGVLAMALAAAGASAITSGLSGGKIGQVLRSAVVAGATAIAFFGVGEITNAVAGVPPGAAHISSAFGTPDYAVNVAGHALVGCGAAVASGGKCGPGALSGAVGSAAGPFLPRGNLALELTSRAVLGGLASVAGGGKFANGAVTAAFGYLFNDLACDVERRVCTGVHPTKDEIDAHYRDGTGWPVFAETMNTAWLCRDQFIAIPIGSSGLIRTNWAYEMALSPNIIRAC